MSRKHPKTRQKDNTQSRGAKVLWLLIGLGSVVFFGLFGVLAWSLISGGDTSGSPTPQVTGAPMLQANQDKLEMGDIKLGQTINAEFDLTNTGNRVLQFTTKPYIEVLEGC